MCVSFCKIQPYTTYIYPTYFPSFSWLWPNNLLVSSLLSVPSAEIQLHQPRVCLLMHSLTFMIIECINAPPEPMWRWQFTAADEKINMFFLICGELTFGLCTGVHHEKVTPKTSTAARPNTTLIDPGYIISQILQDLCLGSGLFLGYLKILITTIINAPLFNIAKILETFSSG